MAGYMTGDCACAKNGATEVVSLKASLAEEVAAEQKLR